MTVPLKSKNILRPQTITAAVTEALREKILSGAIQEGEQLRQDGIAAEYSVSRIPVREALRQLEAEGLVTFYPHRGAVVSELSLDEIQELFENRALLERDILRRAIPNLSDDDFARAQEILDLFEDAFENEDVTVWGQLNWKFHATLYAPAGRPRTLGIIQNLHNNTDRYSRMQLLLTRGGSRAQAEHRRILELCRERDVPQACDFLEYHILGAGSALIEFLTRQRANGP